MDFSPIDWKHVLPQFGIAAQYLTKKHGPCPLCTKGKDRFRFDNKDNQGTYYCSHCGAGNVITLLRKFTGRPDAEILEDIKRFHGLPLAHSPVGPIVPRTNSDEIPEEEVKANRKWLTKARRESKALSNDPVTLYLLNRIPGIDLNKVSKEIKFHPGMKFFELNDDDKSVLKGTFPVMLARVLDSANQAITLHRTYLTTNGEKAPFEKVKKQMPGVRKLRGAACRLTSVSGCRTLGVCEGIETGYAIATAYRYKMPVWAFLNAGNLAVGDIPREKFDKVIIFADHDKIDIKTGLRPGTAAAKALQAKLIEAGFEVIIKMPPREGMDFLDLWIEYYNNVVSTESYNNVRPRVAVNNKIHMKSNNKTLQPA